VNSIVDVKSVVISDGIMETTVLISFTIVVITGELVSIGARVLVVVVVVITVVIFCLETPRDVNTDGERLVCRLEYV
jgi:hypothetical protein